MDTTLIVTGVITAVGVPGAIGAWWAFKFRQKESLPAVALAERQADLKLAQDLREELRKDNEDLRERMDRIERSAREQLDENDALHAQLRELKGRVEVGEAERLELAERLRRSEEENARLRSDNARIVAQNASLHRDNVSLRDQNFQLIGANTMLMEQNAMLRREINDINQLMKVRNIGSDGG